MNSGSDSVGFFSSSVGKKYLIAVTGICFALFLLVHLLGNLFLFVSAEKYNSYSYMLLHNPLIYFAEAALAALFFTHAFLTLWQTFQNRFSRGGDRMCLTTQGVKSVPFASKTMIWHGSVIFVFLIWHLITFKFGPYYEAEYNGVVMRDIHRLVVEVFQIPGYVIWYIAAMLFIGYHLSHGFASCFQSLGFNHPRYTPMIKKIGVFYYLLISIGFIAQPVYIFFFNQ